MSEVQFFFAGFFHSLHSLRIIDMSKIIKSVHLECTLGTSNKEYNIFIDASAPQYQVYGTYGRMGNPINTQPQGFYETLEEANASFAKVMHEKTHKKGYVVVGGDPVPSSSTISTKVSTGLIPQLLNPIDLDELEKYLADDAYLLQAKLDGKRIMAKNINGHVTTSNRNGYECGVPQNIIDNLKIYPDCVLDGELIGSTYHVFDVLEHNGQDLRNAECIDRFKILSQMVKGSGDVKIVQCATDEISKRSLAAALKDEEGVVLKLKDSPYTPSRPNSGGAQIKCKYVQTVTAKVLAVNEKRSVAVGLIDDSYIVNVGNVTIPQNFEIPPVNALVEIRYLHAFVGGSLYQPVYLGDRSDEKDEPDELCSLKFKSEAATV